MRYVICCLLMLQAQAWAADSHVKKGRFLASSPVITALETPRETAQISQVSKAQSELAAARPDSATQSAIQFRACTEALQTQQPFQSAPTSRCQ